MIIICIFPITFLSLSIRPSESLTVNLGEKSCIISNNSTLLGKRDSEKKKEHYRLFLVFFSHYCFLLLFIKLPHYEGHPLFLSNPSHLFMADTKICKKYFLLLYFFLNYFPLLWFLFLWSYWQLIDWNSVRIIFGGKIIRTFNLVKWPKTNLLVGLKCWSTH